MIVVTGANGRYGREAVRHLLGRVPAEELAVSVRDPARAGELVERGVQVRHGDFDDPATLPEAFAGAEKVLIVSTDRLLADRVTQHRNAVDAARDAGVRHVFYTSAPHAELSARRSPVEHLATERRVRESGMAYTFLRNNKYIENYCRRLPERVETGGIRYSSGSGRVALAAITDYAEAAAVVMTGSGHEGATYELCGDRAVSVADFAAAVSEVTGRAFRHEDISDDELLADHLALGYPEALARTLVQDATEIRAGGVLDQATPLLRDMLGRPLTPMTTVVRQALGLPV